VAWMSLPVLGERRLNRSLSGGNVLRRQLSGQQSPPPSSNRACLLLSVSTCYAPRCFRSPSLLQTAPVRFTRNLRTGGVF